VHTNPFKDLPVTKSVGTRERVLSDEELAEIWRAASDTPLPYGMIVRLLILTGQRRGEVAGMTWGEVSESLETWTLSGQRTKNGVTHTVPLSAPARDLLRTLLPEDVVKAKGALNQQRAAGSLVLPGAVSTPFSGWSKAKRALDRAILGARAMFACAADARALDPWSVHDLRRTVATGLQRLGVRLEVTEAVLNHISGSRGGIAGVYQRHDFANEKRSALDSWASYVLALTERRTSDENVLTFTRAS